MTDVPRRPPLAFVDDLESPRLGPEDRHHLTRVQRVRVGDEVTAADGRGRWRPCRLVTDGRLEVLGPVTTLPDVASRTVAVALLKGDRNDLVVQKLTELGLDRIVVFPAARSVARWEPAKVERQRLRFERIAREAAMQSRRARLPDVVVLGGLAEVLAAVTPGGGRVALAEPGGDRPTADLATVLVGPEGGWDPGELTVVSGRVDLGPTVLRAETAAVVAGTLLVALRTGLVGPRP